MGFERSPEQIQIIPQLTKWLLISAVVGLLAGSASAGFLLALEWATNFRESHLWIIALLPIGGFIVGWAYYSLGKRVEAGNNLIIDQIHEPTVTIPLRMMPLVLWGTIMTHFFGGSAGREGTAIQMGASLADQIGDPLRLDSNDRRILLMSGVSAGFGSVFGTPLAGAVFGLEVISIGRMKYDAIFPCLVSSVIANAVTLAWGVRHTEYAIPFVPQITASGLIYATIAGAIFGVTGMLFAKATHGIGAIFRRHVPYPPLRPVIGGVIVAIGVWLVGSTRYIGLGIPTIVEAFQHPLPPWDFFGKFAFTSVTLGAGYKGGEVTPLFYIGATLGNALSYFLPLAPALLAGMGFVAVFAGAANTPISSTLMAIEIFGEKSAIFAGVACVVSYLFSGHAGIYHSQRIGQSKLRSLAKHEGISLKELEQLVESEKKH